MFAHAANRENVSTITNNAKDGPVWCGVLCSTVEQQKKNQKSEQRNRHINKQKMRDEMRAKKMAWS